MKISQSKIVIVGAGEVGSSVAFSLITQCVCDEVVLIDKNRAKAEGEVMDLRQCMEYLDRNTRVTVGEYADCASADIVVMTAAAPLEPGQSRLDMLGSASKIVKSIVEPIMKSGFDGIFLNITNPVDVLSYFIWKLSGFPKNQVIGTGTALDSARLKCTIGGMIDVDPRSIHGFCMGEHGDSLMVPWSCMTIGGKRLTDLLADNKEKFEKIDFTETTQQVIQSAWEIIDRKGATNYAIAAAAVGVIKAILRDENKVIPVSTLLEGEYGEANVFAGVPCVLNRNGVRDVIVAHMSESELSQFHNSLEIIREYTEKL